MSEDIILTKEVEVTIYCVQCEECGNELDFSVAKDPDDDINVTVEPCEKCLDAKYEEGYNEG